MVFGIPLRAPLDRNIETARALGIITRAAALAQLKCPLIWTLMTSSHSCSSSIPQVLECSDPGAADYAVETAEAVHGCLDCVSPSLHGGHVHCGRHGSSASGRIVAATSPSAASDVPASLRSTAAAVIGDNDASPRFGRGQGDGTSDAPASTSDHNRFPLEMAGHWWSLHVPNNWRSPLWCRRTK